MQHFQCKIVKMCGRTCVGVTGGKTARAHARDRDRTSHVCVCARTFATHTLIKSPGNESPSVFFSWFKSCRLNISNLSIVDAKRYCSVFSVLGMYNFVCRQPGENRNHKTLCCFCCTSGPISAVIHTNR